MKITANSMRSVLKITIKIIQSIILISIAFWLSEIIWDAGPKTFLQKKCYTAMVWFLILMVVEHIVNSPIKVKPAEKLFFCDKKNGLQCKSQCQECENLQSESERA